MSERHIPVLLTEVLEALQLKPGMKVVDATLGDAGHSEAMLEKILPKGKLLGLDADTEAILRAKRFLYRFEENAILVHENFVRLQTVVEKHNFSPVQAALLDLGWSTPQFAERGRGFSFEKDEPLDMRYGAKSQYLHKNLPKVSLQAADVVNKYALEDLVKIFKNYGEEKWSQTIAERIVETRKFSPIATTQQLAEIVLAVYREKLGSVKEIPWIGGIHPATKVFQALRIEVNQELEVLKKVLPQAIEILQSGGRLAVITFHSLEDRIVKHFFQSFQNKTIKILTKKPIIASEKELKNNPRSRSAKLRVIAKM